MPVKHCCIMTSFGGQSAWERVEIWKAINVGRDGPRGSCGTGVLPSDVHRRLSTVRGDSTCSQHWIRSFTISKNLHRPLSKSGIAAHLKSGSLKPRGSCQVDGIDLQPRGGGGGDILSWRFGIEHEDSKMAANHFRAPLIKMKTVGSSGPMGNLR